MIQVRFDGTQAGTHLKHLIACLAGWLAALVSQAAFAGTNTQTRVGPYGGSVNNLAFHATNSSIVYATTDSSVFRSTDGGMSWQLAHDEFHDAPRDLAVNASQPERVFASGYSRVVGSANAGATFTRLGVSEQISYGLDVEYSADGSVLYASSGLRVYRSLDHGESWLAGGDIPLIDAAATHLVVDPRDANRLYMAGFTGWGYRSTDAGVTWQVWNVPSNATVNDLAIANTQPRRIWAATNHGTWFTDDDGASWTLSRFEYAQTVTIDPTNPTVVYVGTTRELRRTQNNGSTWGVLNDPAIGAITAIAVDPADSNHLLVGGPGGVASSDDGGAHWSSRKQGMDSLNAQQLVSSPASGRIYVNALGEPTMAISPDDGSTVAFGNQPEGQTLLVIPGEPDRIFGTASNRVVRSLDGGASWSTHVVTSGQAVLGLANASADGLRLIAATVGGVYYTSNGGDTWTPGPTVQPYLTGVMATAPSNPQVVYVVGNVPDASVVILRTADGGNTWSTRQVPTSSVMALAVDPRNDQTLYAGGGAKLLKSIDGGQTWSELILPIIEWWTLALAIDPENPDIVYTGGIGHIARSVDAGASWQMLSYVTDRRVITSSLALDPQRPHSLYVGSFGRGVKEISIQPDLQITALTPDVPTAYGSAGSYSYRIHNAGPFDATGVRTRIQLPPGATDTSAASAGATCTVLGTVATCNTQILRTDASADVTITFTLPTAGSYPVVGTVEAEQPDAAAADNSVTSNIEIAEVTDLSVSLNAPSRINRGEALSFSITVNNAGPNEASQASVTLQLAPGFNIATISPTGGVSTCLATGNTVTCQLPRLPINGSATIAFVTSATTAAGSFTHTAAVVASGTDLRPVNNGGSAVTSVNDPSRGNGGGGSTSLSMLAALLLLSCMRVAVNKFERSARRPLF